MKRIAITAELKERELLFLLILKIKLESQGHIVKFIETRLLCGLKILKFKPDIIIVNGLRSKSNLYKQILIPKMLFDTKVISIYSEQVGKNNGLVETYNYKEILKSVDAHIAWGPYFAEGLSNLGVAQNLIHTSGSLSLDIPKYLNEDSKVREVLSSRYNLDEKKEWIVIADNIIRRGQQAAKYDVRRSEFNKMVISIAENIENVEIIFRSHPEMMSDDIRSLKMVFSKYPKVKIINGEHIQIWISQVNSMIVWRSTSAIEAWTAGKNVFAFQTSDNEYEYWHEKFIQNYSETNKLIKVIEMSLKGFYELPSEYQNSREEYFLNWFFKNDQKAIERLIEVINNISKVNTSKVFKQDFKYCKVISYYLIELIVYIKKIILGDYSKYSINNKNIINLKNFLNI
ncbi:MAG: hypothetical protein WD267_03945 [Balneolales bacterium]